MMFGAFRIFGRYEPHVNFDHFSSIPGQMNHEESFEENVGSHHNHRLFMIYSNRMVIIFIIYHNHKIDTYIIIICRQDHILYILYRFI